MNTVSDTAPSDQSSMGFFSRLVAVYFEPGKAFDDLRRNPRWLVLAILMAFLSFVMAATVLARLGPQLYMRKAIEQSPMAKRMSEEQKQQAIAQAANSPQLYFGVVFAPLGTILGYVILAGIFLLVFMLMGASITFKQSLAATVWSTGPPSLILSMLYIVFTFVKGPEDLDLDPRNNVVTSLGILASAKESPVLYAFLSSPSGSYFCSGLLSPE